MIDLLNRYHSSWIENHTEPDLDSNSEKEDEGYSDISDSESEEVSSDGSSFIENESGEGGMVGDVLKGKVDTLGTNVATTLSSANLVVTTTEQQLIQ